MVSWVRRWRDGVGRLTVVGECGLVAEGPLEKTVGGSGLAGSSDLATPDAAELGGLDGVAGHCNFEQLGGLTLQQRGRWVLGGGFDGSI